MAHLSEDALLIEAFQLRPGLPLGHRRPGLRRRRRRRHRRDARQDQGDELRPGLRPVRVRARPAAADRPGEARGLMDEYFETFGGVRDYLGGVVDEARTGRLHRDDPGPPPLPARPDQRQPAAPRDGRADGAQRADPGLGRRPHQGRDAQRRRGRSARPGWPHGCCSRSTTSSSSRCAEGEREALETLVREQMAGAADLTVPARRLRRHRPQLARRRSLSGGRSAPVPAESARRSVARARAVAIRLTREQRDQQRRVDDEHDASAARRASRRASAERPRARPRPTQTR